MAGHDDRDRAEEGGEADEVAETAGAADAPEEAGQEAGASEALPDRRCRQRHHSAESPSRGPVPHRRPSHPSETAYA